MKRFYWTKQSFENVVPFDASRMHVRRLSLHGQKGVVLPFQHRQAQGASTALIARPMNPMMWLGSMILLALFLAIFGPSVQWNPRP